MGPLIGFGGWISAAAQFKGSFMTSAIGAPQFVKADDEFFRDCNDLAHEVRNAIVAKLPIEPLLEDLPDFAGLSASDGTILMINAAGLALLNDDIGPTGRKIFPYLDERMGVLARVSNEMVLAGAKDLIFRQSGRIQGGGLSNVTTYKASLLGLGHPQMAILAVVKVTPFVAGSPDYRMMTLHEAWMEFAKLKSRDQKIAVAIAHGEKVKAIAESLSVSEKTIENARNTLLKKLSLENPTELVKMMVRFHDSGFSDFNL